MIYLALSKGLTQSHVMHIGKLEKDGLNEISEGQMPK